MEIKPHNLQKTLFPLMQFCKKMLRVSPKMLSIILVIHL